MRPEQMGCDVTSLQVSPLVPIKVGTSYVNIIPYPQRWVYKYTAAVDTGIEAFYTQLRKKIRSSAKNNTNVDRVLVCARQGRFICAVCPRVMTG